MALLDYFLYGDMTSKLNKNNQSSSPQLKDEMMLVIGKIGSQLCQNVIKNVHKTVDFFAAISIINKKIRHQSKLCVLLKT